MGPTISPIDPFTPPNVDTPKPQNQGAGIPVTTGKNGTAPPLTIDIPGESGRFYILHPDDRAAVNADPTGAVDNHLAYPSITTCIGIYDKPALLPWATGQVANVAEKYIKELADMDTDTREEAIRDWLTARPGDRYGRTNINVELRQAAEYIRNQAADQGTTVHSYCEQIAAGGNPEIPEHLTGYTTGYRQFLTDYQPVTFEYLETTVGSTTRGYAGTTDAIAVIGGKRYVIDLKTNKNADVYPTTGMQLAAAANADFIINPDGSRFPVPHIEGGLGVGLAPDGRYKVFQYDVTFGGINHEGFLATVKGFRWKRKADGKAASKAATRNQILGGG